MIDYVSFDVAAGNGGNGLVSFRREKFVPRGGPDGGDGGRGGDVVLVAESRYSTLSNYRDRRARVAGEGQDGGPNRMRGKSADDLVLPVPVGSVIWDLADGTPPEIGDLDASLDPTAEGPKPIADLAKEGDTFIVARGGRGGWGNKRFTSPTRQAPKFAQDGSAGEVRKIRIELKLVADIGLIGLPNAGKSTLLTAWSRATPKIAAYPFTTLDPQIGVVELGYDGFVAADMPGLIEGASEGVGLGHEFLRHIERTRVLVHVLDMTRDDPMEDLKLINGELEAFGHGLAEKLQIIALNKIDDEDAQANVELLEDQIEALEEPTFVISAATTQNTTELATSALETLRRLEREEEEAERLTVPVLRPEPRRRRFEVVRAEDGMAQVIGATPEWLVRTLDLSSQEPRFEFFRRLRRMGVSRALERIGVEPGNLVRIGGVEVRWDL